MESSFGVVFSFLFDVTEKFALFTTWTFLIFLDFGA